MSRPPKISFYPLKQADTDAVELFCCRLAEKAWQLNHRVHIQAASLEQLDRLDELLWQFRAESFLPHQNIDDDREPSAENCKVTLGIGSNLPSNPEVLISLAPAVWEHHDQFEDVRDIVSANEEERELGRVRYRFYQEKNYPIETMKL